MQGWTPAGLLVAGFIVGGIVGFATCYIRGKKGKNKDIAELEEKIKDLTEKLKNK